MRKKKQEVRYGGRALRNGVMMVGPGAVAVAVRRATGKIVTSVEPFTMPGMWARRIPFVRGLVSFAGMIKLARVSTRMENRLNEGGSKVKSIFPQLAPGIGATIADRMARELGKRVDDRYVVPVEAVAGATLPFVAFGISGLAPGVRELWRYHGAEHKAVHTAEAGLSLTPSNATRMSRIHPRCGTTLAFWGLLGGTIVKIALSRMPDGKKKALVGAVSGPLVLSTAYELSRLGNAVKDNPMGRAIFNPAWQTQRFTTAEPDERELEVACASLQAVIDFEKSHGGVKDPKEVEPLSP
jgi:uncharacterized protein YqhQ